MQKSFNLFAAVENIYTPRQRYVLLVASLLGLAGLMLLGLAQYLTAFLAAGILFVVFRPWWVALVHKRRWNARLVTIGILLVTVVVLVIPFYSLSSLLLDRLIAGTPPEAAPRLAQGLMALLALILVLYLVAPTAQQLIATLAVLRPRIGEDRP